MIAKQFPLFKKELLGEGSVLGGLANLFW